MRITVGPTPSWEKEASVRKYHLLQYERGRLNGSRVRAGVVYEASG